MTAVQRLFAKKRFVRSDRIRRTTILASVFLWSCVLHYNAASAGEVIKLTGDPKVADRGFLEELFRAMEPESPYYGSSLTMENLGTGYFDLNDDGVPELFISYFHSTKCGTVGCETDIFRKQNGRWVKFAGLATGDAVFALDEKIGGWRTLCGLEGGLRWGKSRDSGRAEYQNFCVSDQCVREIEEEYPAEYLPLYHRGNTLRLCKDSPVSKR
jgi:hypothetical protein